MSDQYFDIYIKPKDNSNMDKLLSIIELINNKEFHNVVSLPGGENLEDLDRCFNDPINLNIDGGVLFISFTAKPLDPRSVVEFFKLNGADRLEAMVEHTGACDISFYKDSAMHEYYCDAKWDWLSEPYSINLYKRDVCLLGTPSDLTKECVEYFGANCETSFSEVLSDSTNLVVVCNTPDNEQVREAEIRRINIITEEHFADLY